MRRIYEIVVILFFVWAIQSLIYGTNGCAREYSCEGVGCRYNRDTFFIPPLGPVDKWPPRDSSRNELIADYHYYIADNKALKKQYLGVQTVYIPGHYQLIDSIPIQTTPSGWYSGSFDLKSYKLGAGPANLGRIYYDSCFKKGDKFRYFIQIRYKNGSYYNSDTVTLIL